MGLSRLNASKGAVFKAQSDKTPSLVGLNGLFYEQYAVLWQKGRVRHSLFSPFRIIAMERGEGFGDCLAGSDGEIEETLQLFPEGAAS